MAKPSTRQELIDYSLRKLGAPVLEINVDDDQIDDLVDDAIQLFQDRHFDGVEKMYLKYELTQNDIDRGRANETQGVGITTTTATSTSIAGYGTTTNTFQESSNFIQVPDAVIGIEKIFKFDTSTISGGMFSIKYQLMLNDLYYFNSVELLQYAMTKKYLEDIDFLLTTDKQIRFNRRQNRLYLDIDWKQEKAGQFLIIECYRILDPDTFTSVYNDPFLKQYLTALIKRQWGQNLIKFRGVKLPGGLELNGREIYDDAERDIETIKQKMTLEYELPPLDMIGWWIMALNPFFLQGSQTEQRLVQSLINEQLQIYGVEVTYIPRKFVNKETVLNEIQSSKFDDNFLIEAYVNTYEGYSGQGDIMTKFGVSLRDEVTLTISQERFIDFIAPFMEAVPDSEISLITRPREGDLVFFPLGNRLFEVKFVEHENPFYQLGKNYVYELKCELFEYEDEVIDTSIEQIDTVIEDTGFITTLTLAGAGSTATVTSILSQPTGYISNLFLNNDGYGYLTPPSVFITPAPAGGVDATAVAITTTRGGAHAVKEIILTNAGSGYVTPPNITFVSGSGVGAAATASIETVSKGVIDFTITAEGGGYTSAPIVAISTAPVGGINATAVAVLDETNNILSSLRITNPGAGYTVAPTVTIASPVTISGGNYKLNEIVKGQTSGTEARVKSWDADTRILKVSGVGIGTEVTGFANGETIQALESTVFTAGVTTTATVGVQTNLVTGINTTGLVIGQELNAVNNIIGIGATILSIGASQVVMSENSINTTSISGVSLSYGSTSMTSYTLDLYNDTDTYDPFNQGDVFQTEADSIVDFQESNPFGTY